jgi:hypothetical protein
MQRAGRAHPLALLLAGPLDRSGPLALAATPLPVRPLEDIDHGGEQVLLRSPHERRLDRLHEPGLPWELFDQDPQLPPRQATPEPGQIGAVELLKIGLYRRPVLR